MEGRKIVKIVLNAEPYGYSQKAILAWQNKGYNYISCSWDEIKSKQYWPEVDVLIVRLAKKIDSEVLQKFPNLKKIVTATTGLDHIDLLALEKKSISLVSLRGHDEFLNTIPSTAEHTWALLMALIRNVPSANEHVKAGGWNRDLFRGYQLKDKTIGIVGLGRTGLKVADFALAFQMNVVFFDPFVDNERFVKLDSLVELFQQADIVSLHVHLTVETHHLVDAYVLEKSKTGQLLINTSRGKIVDELAVANAITVGKLEGYASDVLATELEDIQLSPLHQLMKKNNKIIITPHIGGATWDAMWACEEYIVNFLV